MYSYTDSTQFMLTLTAGGTVQYYIDGSLHLTSSNKNTRWPLYVGASIDTVDASKDALFDVEGAVLP